MNIKAIREQLMLTQIEFAKLIGVTYQSISNWETGKSKPYAKHKRVIAKVCKEKGIRI